MRYQIYVLNKKADTSRLEHFRIQAQRLRQSYVRIEAYETEAVMDTELAQQYNSSLNEAQYYRSLTPSEITTYINHRQAWQRIVDDEIDFAIVLEDDVLLANSFTYVARTITQLESDWDIIKLAEPYQRVKSIGLERIGAATFVRYPTIPLGLCAYVISASAAQKMLDWSDSFFRPLDVDMQWYWQPSVKVRGLRPYPVQMSHRLGRLPVPAALMKKHQVRRFVGFKEKLKYRWQRRLHSN